MTDLSLELRAARHERRGAILVFSSFLILVLMGIAAIVVDLGIARTTQLQLQASADPAALEGLRGRDADIADPAERDLARRVAAARFAALVFDEDTNLETGPTDYLLGAGPTLSTGVGGIDDPAGGLLVEGGAYLPRLQTNADANLQQGDLVSGDFVALDPADAGNADWHLESDTYDRFDFTPDGALGANSFLARTRRTRDVLGLDNQPGVSSAGPTLPFLFGLGSGVLSAPTPEVYDPRRDGITVRATAIADARIAVAAGVATGDVPGLAPVAFDAADPTVRRWLAFDVSTWSALPSGAPLLFDVLPDGNVVGVAGGPSDALSGLALRVVGSEGARIGSVAPLGAVVLPALVDDLPLARYYVALHGVADAGVAPVVGFSALTIDAVALPGGALRLAATKSPSIVAPANASALLSLAVDPGSVAPLPVGAEPLLAPVLAR